MNISWYQLGGLIVIAAVTINFSEQSSIRKDRPDVNIKGTVTTQAGEHMSAHNITISGKYEQIPVYNKPPAGTDPRKYAVLLDLDELKEIRMKEINQSLVTYQPPDTVETRDDGSVMKRHPAAVEYIELEALYTGEEQQPRTYLIERDKKIWFDEIIGTNRVEHRPHVEAVKRMVIEAIVSNKDEPKKGTANS